jgi:uncharacterized Zn finger protein
MAGFTFRYRISGGAPTIQVIKAKDTETLTKGDLLNLEAGEADLAATADVNLLGVCLDTGARTDSTTDVYVITDADAVYAVADANARVLGATLDIAGATGAQGVAASSNKEFVVVAPSTAADETLVRINVGKSHQNKAQ